MPLSTTKTDIARDIRDGEWWKSIFEPFGLRVAGFTFRDQASIADRNGTYCEVTGDFARAIQERLQPDEVREQCAKIADAYMRACGSVNGREAATDIARRIHADGQSLAGEDK